MIRFEGIYPAVLTAFDERGQFQAGAYERFIHHLYEQGVAGVFACGMIGEGLLMPSEVREHVAETAIRASRGKGQVMIHVSAGSTAEATRLARHAVAAGADGISCLAPHSGGFGAEALRRHFAAVADAAHPLPFLVYYNPAAAPCLDDYGVLESILDLPGVTGVKFSGLNAEDLAYCVVERSPRQNVLTGVDEMLMATQLMGAHGAVAALANLLPGDFVAVRRAALSGDPATAFRHQQRIIRTARLVAPYPFSAALKALAGRCGVEIGPPLAPHLPLTTEQRKELLQSFQCAGL